MFKTQAEGSYLLSADGTTLVLVAPTVSGTFTLNDANVTIYDKLSSQYDKFDNTVKRASSAAEAVKNGDYIFLAVKPQNFPELLEELKTSGVNFEKKTL